MPVGIRAVPVGSTSGSREDRIKGAGKSAAAGCGDDADATATLPESKMRPKSDVAFAIKVAGGVMRVFFGRIQTMREVRSSSRHHRWAVVDLSDVPLEVSCMWYEPSGAGPKPADGFARQYKYGVAGGADVDRKYNGKESLLGLVDMRTQGDAWEVNDESVSKFRVVLAALTPAAKDAAVVKQRRATHVARQSEGGASRGPTPKAYGNRSAALALIVEVDAMMVAELKGELVQCGYTGKKWQAKAVLVLAPNGLRAAGGGGAGGDGGVGGGGAGHRRGGGGGGGGGGVGPVGGGGGGGAGGAGAGGSGSGAGGTGGGAGAEWRPRC